MFLERGLNLLEHMAELLLRLTVHHRCIITVEPIDNMRNMILEAIELEFPQNVTHLAVLQVAHILNALFLKFGNNCVKRILRNFRGFLGLELSEQLIEVIDALVGVVAGLTRRVLLGRTIAVN